MLQAAGTLGDNDMHVDGENIGVFKFFLKVEAGNKLLIIIILENNMQVVGNGFYDSAKDKIFTVQQPYASWSLDENDDWQAPITYPTILGEGDQETPEWLYRISWNET